MNNNENYIYRLLNEAPETSEDFSAEPLSNEEVNNIMKRFKNEENSKNQKRNFSRKNKITVAVATITAAAVLVPTSVYAYRQITANISHTAPYQNTVSIMGVTSETAEPVSEKKEQYMMYKLNYVPDGFVLGDDESEYGGKYHNYETGGGMTPLFYRIPADGKDFQINLEFSESCENYETDGKTAMISYRTGYAENTEKSSENFGRDIWIFFNDTRYLLEIYLTDDISQEDMYKIIDNAVLYPTDKMLFSEYFPWLEDTSAEDKEYEKYIDSITYPVSKDEANILKIGDTAVCGESIEGFNKYDVTINDVSLTDSLYGITTDACGFDADFSDMMDENGNIKKNIRTWIKYGDGVNTIDEDIKTENVPYHILKVNATFKNTSDMENNICIDPDLIAFDENNIPTVFEVGYNIPSGYTASDVGKKIGYRDSVSEYSEIFLSLDADPEHKGSKNSLVLQPDESATVTIYLMYSENRIGKSYLSLCGRFGNSWSQSIKSGSPIIDITDIKP